MPKHSVSLKVDENTTLFGHVWSPESRSSIPAVVVLLHGMGEHIGRYESFAQVLNREGYVVYGHDQRGHGKTGEATTSHGYLGPNGFQQLVDDAAQMVHLVKDAHPNVPVVLFGHSMGSFVAQSFLSRHAGKIDACVLCGSNGPEGRLLLVARYLAKRYARKFGVHAESKLLTKLTFGAYNRAFRPNRTPFDWLTRDTDALQAYLSDSQCGFPLSAASMHDMFTELGEIFRRERMSQIPRDLPIFIIAGEADPVGHQGKGIYRLIDVYRKAGLTAVSYRIYPQARHELLHEINRETVYQDILAWLDSAVRDKLA
ncbi:alpha/beta hydrolase [Alicyclobacillus dauci]|uniref:Alpha/beta hydrolase n=1 Tax=Alicyclobacillus dauci TaxID=1475485 RepID=A0ABY6YXB3_9BACL|nr:alpha/beta hydrolase [Alicyclobacillus dauci]WAH35162.1 alpha/beta hydrolase [Alicyclobacillus dauci]